MNRLPGARITVQAISDPRSPEGWRRHYYANPPYRSILLSTNGLM